MWDQCGRAQTDGLLGYILSCTQRMVINRWLVLVKKYRLQFLQLAELGYCFAQMLCRVWSAFLLNMNWKIVNLYKQCLSQFMHVPVTQLFLMWVWPGRLVTTATGLAVGSVKALLFHSWHIQFMMWNYLFKDFYTRTTGISDKLRAA